MKGNLLTELVSFMEFEVGEARVDQLIEGLNLPSKGCFHAMGDYESAEFMALLSGLSEVSERSRDQLEHAFGRWMFKAFVLSHGQFIRSFHSTFSLLSSVEQEVHSEIRKLNETAVLPTLEADRIDSDAFLFVYRSPLDLVNFCEGLILAALDFYQERGAVSKRTFTTAVETVAIFQVVLEPDR